MENYKDALEISTEVSCRGSVIWWGFYERSGDLVGMVGIQWGSGTDLVGISKGSGGDLVRISWGSSGDLVGIPWGFTKDLMRIWWGSRMGSGGDLMGIW